MGLEAISPAVVQTAQIERSATQSRSARKIEQFVVEIFYGNNGAWENEQYFETWSRAFH